MKILDSGSKREFDTGAHRDATEGKGRFDLLPLREAADLLDDAVIRALSDFYDKREERCLLEAMRESVKTVAQFGGSMAGFLLEASHHYEDGAKKYGENNWRRGMPFKVYFDSAGRHYLKNLRGDVDEPHYRAFAWNILCALYTFRNSDDLGDFGRTD